jgi:hypothetical protein
MREPEKKQQPHGFDVFELTRLGYRLVWAERMYLVRMFLPVFFIGFVGEITLQSLGWETLFIRRALLMLPAFLAQGWLLSHLVRLIFYGQRYPFRFTDDRERDLAILFDRARGIGGGALVYTLLHYFLNGFMAFLPKPGSIPPPPPDADGALPVVAMFISLILLGFLIWLFRMAWLYIPIAAGRSARSYLLALEQRKVASWRLIGVWMVSVLPALFAVLLVEDFLTSLFAQGATKPDDLGKGLTFLFIALEHASVVISSLLATASMALGIKELLNPSTKK